MKIEEGMYVRTKHYGIFKILKIIKENSKILFLKEQGHTVVMSDKSNSIEKEIIGEPSYNIKKLIKIGDFVEYKQSNIHWCIPTRVDGQYNRQQELIELMVGKTPLKDVEITSIVTHEQFDVMKYEVE